MKRTGLKTHVKVEGDKFSKPRIEKKNDWRLWCGDAHREMRDIGKYGQDMDIVLIEKEASVFDLHLSQ